MHQNVALCGNGLSPLLTEQGSCIHVLDQEIFIFEQRNYSCVFTFNHVIQLRGEVSKFVELGILLCNSRFFFFIFVLCKPLSVE